MVARIVGGFAITVFAWAASCFGSGPEESAIPITGDSPVRVVAAVSKPPTSTTTTSTSTTTTTIAIVRPTFVAVTTTSTTSTTTTSTTFPPETSNLVETQYKYYERGPRVVILQEELGMQSVDGVYGPQTRKAHISALGGPTAAIYIFYPEIGETPTPCSHGCQPGDGHYELPTLGELINEYFLPEDRPLARMIAFCESSGQTHDIGSAEVSSALAVGWFQHLAKYWVERSEKAGWKNYDPFNGRANVAVAAWLFYTSGVHHWDPSKSCWEDTPHA